MAGWIIVLVLMAALGATLFVTGNYQARHVPGYGRRGKFTGELAGALILSAVVATAFLLALFWAASWLRGS